MAIPQGTGWDWLSRTRNLVWLGSFIVAGAVAVWTEVDGLPPSVIAVFALAAFVLVLLGAVAAKHLFASSPPTPLPYTPGSRSEEYVVETLKKGEEDKRSLAEEASKEREQRRATADEFERLQRRYEERDAYARKMDELFLGMTNQFDRTMVWYELAQNALNDIDGALRATDLDGDRHWRPPNIGEGRPPISTEDAVRYASRLLYEYTKKRVAEIEKPPIDGPT